jgi:hypothetical protein
MKATKTLKTAIDAAVELSERFPDLSNRDVLDHVAYVMDTQYESERTVVAIAIIYAYDHGEDEAYRYCAGAFGIDMRGK